MPYYSPTRSARGQNQWGCSERQQLSVPSGRAKNASRSPGPTFVAERFGYGEGMGHKPDSNNLGPCGQQSTAAGRGPHRNR